MKQITSFTKLTTGEGLRIAYTYSDIDENGLILSQNNKGSFVVVNQEVTNAINIIEDYINQRFLI